MRILAIIPARGGSKGIPKKNIIPINGKPLIGYTIDLAKVATKSKLIDKFIVSTDDLEIAEISKDLGADVPFLRPSEISDDKAKSVDFILHALNYFKNNGEEFDAVMLLQPTSPLREINDFFYIINTFKNIENDSIISVYKEDHVHDLVCYYLDKDKGIPLNSEHNVGKRRQEHESIYVRNGAFYLTKTKYILEEKKVFSDNPTLYIMDKQRSINLDSVGDLELLKCIMKC